MLDIMLNIMLNIMLGNILGNTLGNPALFLNQGRSIHCIVSWQSSTVY